MMLSQIDPEGKIPLPSMIKKLSADGILPKSLEQDLLVYKPNPILNF
jgi:hypothetical protein